MVTIVPKPRSFLITSMGLTFNLSDKSLTVTTSGMRSFCRAGDSTADAEAPAPAPTSCADRSPCLAVSWSGRGACAVLSGGRGVGVLIGLGGGILYVAVG